MTFSVFTQIKQSEHVWTADLFRPEFYDYRTSPFFLFVKFLVLKLHCIYFIFKITIIQDLTKEHKRYIYVPWVYPTLIHVMLNLLFHFYCCMYLGETAVPCMRNIRPEEIWLYKYPRRPNYIPVWMLWAEVFTVGKFAMSEP